MRPSFPLPRLVTLALLLSPASGIAQDSGRTVNFRTVCLEHRDGLTSVMAPSGKPGSGEALEVPLYTGTFSEVFKGTFTGGQASFFVDDPEAENGRRLVATGKLLASDQQVFVFVPSAKDDKQPYRILATSDAEKDFPMGGVRLLNLCQGPVRLNFAGADLPPVATGKFAVYPPVKAVDEWGMYQVRIDYGTPDGKWVPVSTPSWKSTPLKRDLVVTTLDPRTKQPRIFNYKDIPPWRKPVLVAPE